MRANIILWMLLGFAQSILLINSGLYFSRWLVVDLGSPTYAYNAILALSAAVIFVTAVPYGRLVDRLVSPKIAIAVSTAITFAAASGIGSLALVPSSNTAYLAAVSFLYGLTVLAFQSATIALNGLLRTAFHTVSTGLLSGLGAATGWFGSITGILITIPFVQGHVVTGYEGNAAAFLPAAVAFGAISLSAIFFLNLPAKSSSFAAQESAAELRLASLPLGLVLFLLGALFIIDMISTIEANIPLYLDVVFGIGNDRQPFLILFILVGGAFGGLSSAIIRYNHLVSLPRVVLVTGMMLVANVGLLALATPGTALLFAVMLSSGFCVAALEASLREGLVRYAPANSANTAFAYYGIVNRSATLLGTGVTAIILWAHPGPADGFRLSYLVVGLIGTAGIVSVVISLMRSGLAPSEPRIDA